MTQSAQPETTAGLNDSTTQASHNHGRIVTIIDGLSLTTGDNSADHLAKEGQERTLRLVQVVEDKYVKTSRKGGFNRHDDNGCYEYSALGVCQEESMFGKQQ